MKKSVMICLLLLGVAVVGRAQDATLETAPVQTFNAGGIAIAIPPPTLDLLEVGYDNREFMEVFVPSSNRLIAAFVPTQDLPKLRKGTDAIISKYALVEVPRQGEYMDCGQGDFKEVTDGLKNQFGDGMNSSMNEVEEEFNRRMKSMNLSETTLSLGKPLQLGTFFSKQDAYAFGMIMPLTVAGHNLKTGMGGIILRVKQRLLFVYLYAQYENDETITWLRKTTEVWADAILKANE